MKGIEAVKSNIQAAKAVSRVRAPSSTPRAVGRLPLALPRCRLRCHLPCRCHRLLPTAFTLRSAAACSAAACRLHQGQTRPLCSLSNTAKHTHVPPQVLRTSLGPKGMDKMLQGPDGDIVISEQALLPPPLLPLLLPPLAWLHLLPPPPLPLHQPSCTCLAARRRCLAAPAAAATAAAAPATAGLAAPAAAATAAAAPA